MGRVMRDDQEERRTAIRYAINMVAFDLDLDFALPINTHWSVR